MSVIFQTLKKLQGQPSDGKGINIPRTRKRRSIGLRWMLQTPLGMGLFIGAIFAVGFGSLHLLEQISASQPGLRVGSYKAPVESGPMPQSDPRQKNSDLSQSTVNRMDAPPASDEMEVAAVAAPVYYPANSDSTYSTQTSFTPVQSSTNSQLLPPDLSTIAAVDIEANSQKMYSMPNSSEDVSATASFTPASKTQVFLSEKNNSNSMNSFYPINPGTPAGQDQLQQPTSADSVLENDDSHAIFDGPAGERDSDYFQTSGQQNVDAVTAQADAHLTEHLADLEKFQRAAGKRTGIVKLISQLENAMDRMDKSTVSELFDQLAEMKGGNSPYLLNMQAYWYLRQDLFADAEVLLLKILAMDADHLEAGVNLAIVEAKTQRKAVALKRLKQLRDLYPENTVVADMIRKLS